MTVAEMRRQLFPFPPEAEVIFKTGEDSRDNPTYALVESMYVSTLEQIDSEYLWMEFEEDAKVVVLKTA